MKVYNSITELAGGTPLLKLNRIGSEKELDFNKFEGNKINYDDIK